MEHVYPGDESLTYNYVFRKIYGSGRGISFLACMEINMETIYTKFGSLYYGLSQINNLEDQISEKSFYISFKSTTQATKVTVRLRMKSQLYAWRHSSCDTFLHLINDFG